jgi:hypothetical protein
MPISVWSRFVVLLTGLGALLTLLSRLRRPVRLALLVVLGVVAVQSIPVYLIYLCSLARHRKRVLASIEANGGHIAARLAADPRLILELDLSHQDLSALAWDSLHSLLELQSLNLAFSNLTDDHLDELCRLLALRHLDLTGTAVTDRGMAAFRSFPRLEFVSLRGTLVTEDALDDLACSLPHLFVDADGLPRLDNFDASKDVAYDTRV